MKKRTKIRPEARKESDRLRTEFGIDDAGGEVLLATFEAAYSLEIDCEDQVFREGLTLLDRFGQTKSHPLLSTLRDARAQKLSALKMLNLDVEPLHPGPGRPPGR